jgi:CheY-like chemotaxis protein
MTKSDQSGSAPGQSMPGLQPPPREPDWRRVFHQLNNIFASIHSSLDLALALPGQPQARGFLVQAQTSAREGALLVHGLMFGGKEPPGRESVSPTQELKPNRSAAGLVAAPPASLEGSERILLVEDDESVRLLVRAVLSYRGYEVTEACDGEDGVKLFRQRGPFDLVILDQAMPKLGGRAALEQIRAVDAGVRTLGLSGLPPERDQSPQAAAQGFDAQLSKPFDNTELVVVVRQLLDRRAQSRNEDAKGRAAGAQPQPPGK